MWDDVIIGKGPHTCSAVKCFEDPKAHSYVSENGNSYWISDLILGGGMKIFKDTEEGKKLTEMLNAPKIDATGITNYLNKLFLNHAKSKTLIALIKIATDKAYEQGKEDKAEEIRRALGIYNY